MKIINRVSSYLAAFYLGCLAAGQFRFSLNTDPLIWILALLAFAASLAYSELD